MNNIDQNYTRVIKFLKESSSSTTNLAKESGVPESTLRGIRKGFHVASINTLLKIEKIIPEDFKPDV